MKMTFAHNEMAKIAENRFTCFTNSQVHSTYDHNVQIGPDLVYPLKFKVTAHNKAQLNKKKNKNENQASKKKHCDAFLKFRVCLEKLLLNQVIS